MEGSEIEKSNFTMRAQSGVENANDIKASLVFDADTKAMSTWVKFEVSDEELEVIKKRKAVYIGFLGQGMPHTMASGFHPTEMGLVALTVADMNELFGHDGKGKG